MDEQITRKILEKTEILNQTQNLQKYNINNTKPKKKSILNIFSIITFVITLIIGICYFGYNLLFSGNQTNQLYLVVNSATMVVITILFIMTMLIYNKKAKKIMSIVTSLFLSIYIGFNFLITTNSINLPTQDVLKDFTNKNINEVIEWAKSNNITIEQTYEYSDNIPEYHIISQSVAPNTLLKSVEKINFVVSSGPNYDKLIIIPNMIGWHIDDVLKTIEENYLNNVQIEYSVNEEIEKDYIYEQSVRGQMRRNDLLTLKISLGNADSLEPVNMAELKNLKLFDATLWLKRNGIPYTLKYEFSDKIKRNYIIGQSILKDTLVDQKKDSVILIVSKGKEIVVPDLKNMTIDEVTKWVIENNLKIRYEDKYDANIPLGNIIDANYKAGDIVEEETTISIVTSKGQLRMQKFSSLSEFRDWASRYNIQINEVYEYNSLVKKGNIIKFSHEENMVIAPTDTVTVYVSNGAPVTIPNFYGKSKNEIKTTCSKIGLNCTFTYSGYSNVAKDVAVSQNKKAGSTVISGTNVVISLSQGPAKTFVVEMTEAQVSIGNADGTIATLKQWFASQYPGVTFTFVKKPSNSFPLAGYFHEDSPIKDGSVVKQGQTYQVWITN